jgi:hypothetical protein
VFLDGGSIFSPQILFFLILRKIWSSDKDKIAESFFRLATSLTTANIFLASLLASSGNVKASTAIFCLR